MSFRLVHESWGGELEHALRLDRSELRILSPFMQAGALARLLPHRPERTRVITRFNLNDFADGVSDISVLRTLLDVGASVRGIRHLHAKLYVFGRSVAIVTSANLTNAGLTSNHEFGAVIEDREAIESCCRYFDDLWSRSRSDLRHEDLAAWTAMLSRHLAAGAQPGDSGSLPDYGADTSLAAPPRSRIPPLFAHAADTGQAFVKFHGISRDRTPLSRPTLQDIESAGCHRVLAYRRRPRIVRDGDLMFVARLTEEPDGSRIYGRAIAMKHQPTRDDATPADVERRSWMSQWSHFVRVHHAEFVQGTLANGIRLRELIDEFDTDSFVRTQERAASGETNIHTLRSLGQKPAVRLTQQAREWLGERLQAAFDEHGTVPPSVLAGLDWPEPPQG